MKKAKTQSFFKQHPRVSVKFSAPSLCEQTHKKECDINYILDKYRQTGLVNHVNRFQGSYGDFDDVDYHQAMNIVIEANESFNSLPSDIRKRFSNNPELFLEFINNPENIDEMVELGLATKADSSVSTRSVDTEETQASESAPGSEATESVNTGDKSENE